MTVRAFTGVCLALVDVREPGGHDPVDPVGEQVPGRVEDLAGKPGVGPEDEREAEQEGHDGVPGRVGRHLAVGRRGAEVERRPVVVGQGAEERGTGVLWSIQTSSMAPPVEMTAAAGIDQICTRPGLRTSPPI